MRRLAAWAAVAALLAGAGCASVAPGPPRLQVVIAPETVHPGDVVTVRVAAPPGTRRVTGRLDLGGSPTLPLKTGDGGATWTFVTQVPLAATWPPGRYKVIVHGEGPDGAALDGSAWVTAP